MKKFILLFILVVSAVFSFAQKSALVRMTIGDLRALSPAAFSKFLQENPKFILVTAEKETVYSAALLKASWPDLKSYAYSMHLSQRSFPVSAKENEILLRQSLEKMSLDMKRFEARSKALLPNLQNEVVTEVPYENYLPEKADFIFAGEIHRYPRVQEEVLSFVRGVIKKYPNRPVYVATEFVMDASDDSILQTSSVAEDLMLIKSKEELTEMQGERFYASSVLFSLLEEGVTVVGLEPQHYLVDKIELEASLTPETFVRIAGLYQEYAGSESGFALRNQIWAQHLQRLKQEHPDAVIVVYGGAWHMAYQIKHSVTNMLDGNKFVAFFAPANERKALNPLFRFVEGSQKLRDAFYADKNAKMVTFWKRPTNYKQLLGADLSVIMHAKYQNNFN